MFRIRSGPVVLKLNSVETRGIILGSNPVLKRRGISAAPDYTLRQREARKHWIFVLNDALSKRHQAKVRGEKLSINGKMFIFDFFSKWVKEVVSNREIL